MNIWRVLARGEGFHRNGSAMSFELSGLVSAEDPNAAFAKAVHIAKKDFAEIGQAEQPGFPRAVINAEEIQAYFDMPACELDKIEILWFGANEAESVIQADGSDAT